MKDDTPTPTPDGDPPNTFEQDKPRTNARSQAEAAIEDLRRRGGPFVNAVRATRMPMVLTDPNLPGNPIVFANKAFLRLSGYAMDEVLGQQPHFMDGPETDRRDVARFAEVLRGDQDHLIETVQYRKNGSRFVATVLLSAFKDDHGRTVNHFMSWLDVTRRMEAEQEVSESRVLEAALRENETRLRILLSELQHRVRNTLALVKSITARTAESSDTVEDMAAHLHGRLDAFARVQAAVTRNPDSGVDVTALVTDELLAHATHEGKQLSIEGPDVALWPKAAESFGLAIHELATNAVKHGALTAGNGKSGKVAVKWKLNGSGDKKALRFEWVEKGLNGKLAEPTRSGFGMELLTRLLPYDLGATTKVEFPPTGLRFMMDLPIEHVAEPKQGRA